MLNEEEVHSYQHEAESVKINDQTITKTTVMNKVHCVEKEIPGLETTPEEKKQHEVIKKIVRLDKMNYNYAMNQG